MSAIDEHTKRLIRIQIEENSRKSRLRRSARTPITQSTPIQGLKNLVFRNSTALVLLFILWSLGLIAIVASVTKQLLIFAYLIFDEWLLNIALVLTKLASAFYDLGTSLLDGNSAFETFYLDLTDIWNNIIVDYCQLKRIQGAYVLKVIKIYSNHYSNVIQLQIYDSQMEHFELYYLGVQMNYYTRRLLRDSLRICKTYPRSVITVSIIVASTIIVTFVRRRSGRSIERVLQLADSAPPTELSALTADVPTTVTIKKKKTSSKKLTPFENRAIRRQRKEDIQDKSDISKKAQALPPIVEKDFGLRVEEEEPNYDNMPGLMDASDTEPEDSDG